MVQSRGDWYLENLKDDQLGVSHLCERAEHLHAIALHRVLCSLSLVALRRNGNLYRPNGSRRDNDSSLPQGIADVRYTAIVDVRSLREEEGLGLATVMTVTTRSSGGHFVNGSTYIENSGRSTKMIPSMNPVVFAPSTGGVPWKLRSVSRRPAP